ncbi:hypothetical protein SANTM175S_04468 [Streptomyces antimycoticus]
MALADGPKQYTGLLGTIREKTHEDGWSETRHLYLQESVLNRTLRRLEREELVERHREPTFPYRARYQFDVGCQRAADSSHAADGVALNIMRIL